MMEKYLSSLAKNVKPSGLEHLFSLASEIEGVVSLGVGEPDFDTPWHIREEAIFAIEKGSTFYTDNRGLTDLKNEIGLYLDRRFDLKYDPKKEIMVTVGGSEGIDVIMRSLLDKGDEVILPEPCYIAYEPCIDMAGGVSVKVELKEEDQFKLKKEQLEQAITEKTKAVLINFPGNPTGGIMTREDYEELVPLIKKHELLVITDEIYAELTYDGIKHVSIADFEEIKDQVILVSGFSKAYSMTGWRLGYICAHETLLSAFSKVHQYAVMCPPTISQYAGIEAMKKGDADAEAMKESFEQRRSFIVNGLNRIGLACHKPQGAFYVFPSITCTGLTSKQFCEQLLAAEKVAVVPGDAFGQSGEGYIRISYAYSIDEIKEALTRIERFLNSLK